MGGFSRSRCLWLFALSHGSNELGLVAAAEPTGVELVLDLHDRAAIGAEAWPAGCTDEVLPGAARDLVVTSHGFPDDAGADGPAEEGQEAHGAEVLAGDVGSVSGGDTGAARHEGTGPGSDQAAPEAHVPSLLLEEGLDGAGPKTSAQILPASFRHVCILREPKEY